MIMQNILIDSRQFIWASFGVTRFQVPVVHFVFEHCKYIW